MKLSDLVNSRAALTTLNQEKLPAKVAYRISKIIRLVDPELEAYGKALNELIVKYDLKQGDKVPPEFAKDLTDILAEDVTIEVPKLDITDLPSMTAADMQALDWLINNPPES